MLFLNILLYKTIYFSLYHTVIPSDTLKWHSQLKCGLQIHQWNEGLSLRRKKRFVLIHGMGQLLKRWDAISSIISLFVQIIMRSK